MKIATWIAVCVALFIVFFTVRKVGVNIIAIGVCKWN